MNVKKIALLVAFSGLSASSAFATNSYFSHGFGMKAKGMAGVGIALPQDGLAAATNPAGMVMVGDRMDIGLDWFKPVRGADISGNNTGFPGFNLNGSYNGNGDGSFLIPEFGYNRMLGADKSVGLSIFGNGGMNTRYTTSPFATGQMGPLGLGGQNPGGVNLEQLFIAPTFSMKVNKDNALGASLIFAQQRFGATGLQAFKNFPGASVSPNDLTDRGNDTTYGWGIRLGWTGQVTDAITLGATYASKINGKFDAYKGLFAGGGEFDIPENYGIGIAVKATPQLTVAADIQQINYAKVKAIGNTINCFFAGTCQLGADNGPGFGWRDMTVYKLGVSYDYSKDLTLRGGFSTTRQPIPATQTFFNILAPGVVENHLTLGGTWTMANKDELTISYMHAFSKTINGSGSISAPFGGGESNIHMYEDSLGIAYGVKFK